MVYDPKFSFKEAYSGGYGPLDLFNANGVTTMNLGLQYYEADNGTDYYSYGTASSGAYAAFDHTLVQLIVFNKC